MLKQVQHDDNCEDGNINSKVIANVIFSNSNVNIKNNSNLVIIKMFKFYLPFMMYKLNKYIIIMQKYSIYHCIINFFLYFKKVFLNFHKLINFKVMLNRFLNGFISLIPFFYRDNTKVKFFPEDIYVNDWKIIGNIMKNIIKK